MNAVRPFAAAVLLSSAVFVAGCQDGIMSLLPKAEKPIPYELTTKMKAKGMSPSSPIMIRIFKEENVAEVWKKTDTGRYALLSDFEICKWSGKLGPKFKEGDRQAPEGYYAIRPWQMNPNSDYHLSFNLGFPNAYDQAHNRTGSHLMMHGACSSAGCYSMTDDRIEAIFALARESFKGGQTEFQVEAYPFQMTPENMAKHADSEHFEFWKMLKEGYDQFEITGNPPKVDVCDRRYVFNQVLENEKAKFISTQACPAMSMPDSLALAYAEKLSKDEEIFQQALKKEAVRAAWRGEKAPIEVLALTVDEGKVDTNAVTATATAVKVPTPLPAPR
jgi:murein L,D-transpeptidase YafK